MIVPGPPQPTLWPPTTISRDKGGELLERVLEDLVAEDQWISDFIKRLNYTVVDIVRKK